MILIETTVFTRQISKLLKSESYREFQLWLADEPGRGALIPGTGRLRKIRWEGSGGGKQGGTRIIYYWARDREIILLLVAYAKNEKDDLSKDQLRVLRRLVKEEFK